MTTTDSVLAGLDTIMPSLEDLYRDVHAHPELSMQEHRTAGRAAAHLRAAGYEVTTEMGGTGVVGVLANGEGPTVMLRADMDALPVKEATGLPYASTATATDPSGAEVPVMHACGHDMHVTWLAGATALLASARDAWSGTVLAVFQPAEETAQGAQAMIDELQLQTIVSREIAASQSAVVTIGALQAGTKDNVIPDDALLKLNIRTFDEQVRTHVLEAIRRIVEAEATASGAPRALEITTTEHYPLTVNDPDRTARVAAVLRARLGQDRVHELTAPYSASEDFGSFGTQWGVPSVFWYVGGTDTELYRKAQQSGRVAQDIPTNHNARFAPVIHPTLETGVEAIAAAALDALANP